MHYTDENSEAQRKEKYYQHQTATEPHSHDLKPGLSNSKSRILYLSDRLLYGTKVILKTQSVRFPQHKAQRGHSSRPLRHESHLISCRSKCLQAETMSVAEPRQGDLVDVRTTLT